MARSVGSVAAAARPLRADARRNRDAVLAVAVDAFARDGVDASLEEIARAAGVGIGTLYRHFPTREELVFAVYRREVEQLAEAAPLLAAQLEPGAALLAWMRRFARYAATKRGLIGLLRTMIEQQSEVFEALKQQIREAADGLLRAAAQAGDIRPDISGEDLMRGLHGICIVSGPDTAAGLEHADRLVDLLYDGLRYGVRKTE